MKLSSFKEDSGLTKESENRVLEKFDTGYRISQIL